MKQETYQHIIQWMADEMEVQENLDGYSIIATLINGQSEPIHAINPVDNINSLRQQIHQLKQANINPDLHQDFIFTSRDQKTYFGLESIVTLTLQSKPKPDIW